MDLNSWISNWDSNNKKYNNLWNYWNAYKEVWAYIEQYSKQINTIIWAKEEQIDISDRNRFLSVKQLETIQSFPVINDFYNFFFVEENEITYDEDLKRHINYFWWLVLNDIDKMFIFCVVLIDFYQHKIDNLLLQANNLKNSDYLTTIWRINFLKKFREQLLELRQKLDSFYNFKDSNSAEHQYFSSLIMSWQIKTAYDYANSRISNEFNAYKEVYRIIYWQDIDIDEKSLPKYPIWMRQIIQIKQEFPSIFYN